MTTDLDRRVAAGLRRVADALPVTAPPPATVRGRAGRPARARGWRPVVAGVAVAAAVAAVAVLPGLGLRGGGGYAPAAPDTGTAVLPSRFAGMSLLTAPVSDAPPGPVVAMWRQGSLGSRWGSSQLLVLGADGRTYRRLDRSEDAGSAAADGEWVAAPAVPAPDGAAAAVGARRGDGLAVVDLRSGAVRGLPVADGRPVTPLAWSPDGGRLLVALEDPQDQDGYAGGSLYAVDVRTGAAAAPAARRVWGARALDAAYSPDGRSVAVPVGERRVDVLDAVTWAVRRTVTAPQDVSGRVAWSPDGRVLAFETGDGISFAAAAPGAAAPATVRTPDGTTGLDLLGWPASDGLLLGVGSEDYAVVRQPVDGGPAEPVARLPQGPAGVARVSAVQLTARFQSGLVVEGSPGVDRGPWPRWWTCTVVAVALAAGLVVLRRVRRRAGRRVPEPAAATGGGWLRGRLRR